MTKTNKLLAAILAVSLISLGALTLLLRAYLSPEKVRTLVIDAARKALKREVRLGAVAVGPIKGLVLEDLEVSEKPDFSAGRFASVGSFQLRVRLAPLLHRKVVVDRIAVSDLKVSIIKAKDGTFNFSDLSGSSSQQASAAPLPFELAVRKASLSGGSVEYLDAAAPGRWRIADIKAEADDASLSKPFKLNLSARAEQDGQPKGSFAFTGRPDPAGRVDLDSVSFDFPGGTIKLRGSVEKKGEVLTAAIDKLSGNAFGNALDLSGRLRLDAETISLPNLKGTFDDGPMSLDLRVLHYDKAPEAIFKANLASFNADKLMAPASGDKKPAPVRSSGPPAKASGTLAIGKLSYSGAVANKLSASWNLSGITPDLRGLGGQASLRIEGGSFQDSGPPKSALVRALLLPLTLLKFIGQTVGRLAGVDFSHILFSEIAGDYAFDKGVMTVRDFHVNSAAANVLTKGTVDLPAQKLGLSATVLVAKLAPIELEIGGTFDKPETKLKLVKTLTAPVRKLVTEPGLNLLKKIFPSK